MTETTDHPDSLLKSHASALRQLAEHLLNDPHEVDDALQDCWAQVLASPPPRNHSIRAWLETVLRNVVRKQARTRQRVKYRERQSARSERLAPTFDVVARRQTLSALTKAIDSLDEGSQELVFLRYFNDLPPRAIAAQVGRPVEQVYKELERARHKLRASLEREHKDWRAAIVGLCGLHPSPAAAGWLLTGGLLMLIQNKILLGLGSVLAIFLVAALYQEDDSPSLSQRAAGPAKQAEQLQAVAMHASANPNALREELKPIEAAHLALSPYEYQLEILAIDEDDLPASNFDILIAPFGHDLNTIVTDSRGIAQVRWRARTSGFDLVYGAIKRTIGEAAVQRASLRAGGVNRLVLRVRRQHIVSLSGRFLLSMLHESTEGQSNAWIDASNARFPAMISVDGGFSEFVTRCQAASIVPPRSQTGSLNALTEFTTDAPRALNSTWRVDTQRESEGDGTGDFGKIRGVVLCADGSPADKALIHASRETESGISTYHTHCDKQGVYKLGDLPAGQYSVRAGGGELGRADWQFSITAGAELEWNPALDRGLELKLQVVDSSNQALPGWRIEVFADGVEDWVDGGTAGKAGQLSIPNLENRAHKLRCYSPKGLVPLWTATAIWPSAETITLHIPDAALSRGDCRITPSVVDDSKWTFGPIQLWRNGGHGVSVFEGNDKGFDVGGLPSDIWQVLVAGRGFGFGSSSDLNLLPTGRTDHAFVRGEPTSLGLPEELELGDGLVEIRYLHKDVVSRSGGLSQNVRKLWLRPGSYLVQHGELSWRLEVRTGEQELSWPE